MAYCTSDDVYRTAGITSSDVPVADVDKFISETDEYIDHFFNTTFETKSFTELRDGNGSRTIFTQYFPIDSVTTLTIDGTNIDSTDLYIYSRIGKITLKETAPEQYFKNIYPQQVNITYVYGYNLDFTTITNNQNWNKIAYLIQSLSAKIAAIASLANQIGGTFDDVTSYQLPEFSASKGEPYTNIRETIIRLENEVKQLLTNPTLKALASNVYYA